MPTLIHLAETRDEVKTAQERFKSSPVAYLDSLGFLGPGRARRARRLGVRRRHRPAEGARRRRLAQPRKQHEAGERHGAGPGYLRADVALGLGTDGAASNNDLDMFEAMRVASLLHKLQTMDPRVVSAKTALEMATIGGARALGMEKRIGSLERGKRADLIVVTPGARQTPMYDPISHLVYVTRGDDVQTTIVNGKVLMRDRKVLTLDERAVLSEARAWVARRSQRRRACPQSPMTPNVTAGSGTARRSRARSRRRTCPRS